VPRQQRNDEMRDFMDGVFQRAIGYALIAEWQQSGTDGGTFNSGSWVTRVLNTVAFDTIGVVLAGNAFTLPRGVYEIDGHAPAWEVNRHMVRLYDVTNGVAVLWGTSEITQSRQDAIVHTQSRSFVRGRVYVPAPTAYRLEHRCQTTVANVGLGLNSGWAFAVAHETYAEVMIHQVG